MTVGRHAESSGASGRESSRCSSAYRLTPGQRTECTGSAYFDILTVRISGRFLFCTEGE
nr:MAG TPA: hypothetical protein [Siphoviridae sp. ctAeS79]